MKIIIVGGGETGLTLANLLGEKDEVTIIEEDEKLAKEIANKTSSLVINGKGVDVAILEEAGIKNADAVVATTSNDEINLMVCQIAKSDDDNKKVVSLVNSPKNEELFIKLKISNLVSVAGTTASAIKNTLYGPSDERVIAQLGQGDVQVIEQTIEKKSSLIGKKAEIKNGIIAAIYRGGEIIIPNKNLLLKKGDVLIVAVKSENLSKILELFKK
jgi:Trk K+ transport system NAD-binding subunit